MPGWLPYLICWGVFATDPCMTRYVVCNTQTHIKPNATENMERAHQNEHSKRANATQVKDTLNTMPGGELK